MNELTDSNGLSVSRVSTLDDFRNLKEEWAALLSSSSADNFFLTWEWIFHWWESYRESKELFLLTLKDSRGRLQGLAPFYRREVKIKRLVFREVLFLGSGESPYPDHLDIIAARGREERVAEAVAVYLKREKKRWDILRVINTDQDNSCLNLMLAGLRCFPFSNRILENEQAYLVELPASWEDYLASLSRNSRRNLIKRRRRFEKKGMVTRVCVKEPDRLGESLERLAAMHQSRMGEKNISGKFSDRRHRGFHGKLAADLLEKGRLNLCFLMLGGKAVAVRYGFIHGETLYDYQSGYLPEHGKDDVGNVLLGYMIEDAIERGLRKFDFLSGDYPFKRSLANRERRTGHIVVINCLGKGLLYYLGLQLKARATPIHE